MAGGWGTASPTDPGSDQENSQVIWGKARWEEGSLQQRKTHHLPIRHLPSSVQRAPPNCIPVRSPQGALSPPKVVISPGQSQIRSSEQPGAGAKPSFRELPGPSHGTPSRKEAIGDQSTRGCSWQLQGCRGWGVGCRRQAPSIQEVPPSPYRPMGSSSCQSSPHRRLAAPSLPIRCLEAFWA